MQLILKNHFFYQTIVCLLNLLFPKAIFQMDQNVDQLDAGGGITDLVFDEKNHERSSWKFSNSRVPRSEVVYFSQIFIILFLIAISLIKLVFFKPDCEEATFWCALLSYLSQYYE